MPPITLIVAVDTAGGIGADNKMPWHLPQDLAHFKALTMGHPIIMGRKTFDSIGRPLPNRRSIVITRNPDWKHAGVDAVTSLDAAVTLVGAAEAFIIGGAQIFNKALLRADKLIVTEIDKTFDCDTFFPQIDLQQWQEVAREQHQSVKTGLPYAFVTYQRR